MKYKYNYVEKYPPDKRPRRAALCPPLPYNHAPTLAQALHPHPPHTPHTQTIIEIDSRFNFSRFSYSRLISFPAKSNVIVLFSGCDSGFGLEVAKHLTRLGFKVFAGCLRKKQGGPGVKELVCSTNNNYEKSLR
jgi:hypothetical protein